MVKIIKVETVELDHSTVWYGGWLSWLWVRIHTDNGLVGLGKTYPSAASEKLIIMAELRASRWPEKNAAEPEPIPPLGGR